jgi:hypothetical protein
VRAEGRDARHPVVISSRKNRGNRPEGIDMLDMVDTVELIVVAKCMQCGEHESVASQVSVACEIKRERIEAAWLPA